MSAPSSVASASDAPIGVFDSGIGGLSVLQALRAELPAERFVYLADTGHAPYGERGDAFVARRTHAVARYLVQQHGAKALVVACNTATAAAMDSLRQRYPRLPLVGVEPALKPAASATHTGHIAVMATRGTVSSARFERLIAALPPQVQCRIQACDGLASAIEAQAACAPQDSAADAAKTLELCRRYVKALGPWGEKAGETDTLVLGCTHYVFAQEVLQQLLGPKVQILSTGEPVARQTRRLLANAGCLQPLDTLPKHADVCLLTTGSAAPLDMAVLRWLGLSARARTLAAHGKKLSQITI